MIDAGCGSNVSTTGSALSSCAPRSSASMTRRWPRWTPSNVPIASTKRRPRGSSSMSRSTFIYARPSLSEDLLGLQHAVPGARNRHETARLVQHAHQPCVSGAAQLLAARQMRDLGRVECQLGEVEPRVHGQQQILRAAVAERVAYLVNCVSLLDPERA